MSTKFYKSPLVTIAIPIYNSESYLRDAIQSCFNQTFKDWELLLMCDGSTDNSNLIVYEMACLDKRVKVIDDKSKYAHFMAEGITHICKNLPKRDPGSEGEKLACEYMGDVLKNECGCEYTKLESFKENPGSFFGWIYVRCLCSRSTRGFDEVIVCTSNDKLFA